MLGEVELLLTDEFEGFAAEIKKIHDVKKAKAAEMKEIYAKFQLEVAALDAEAKKIYDEWQANLGKKAASKKDKPAS